MDPGADLQHEGASLPPAPPPEAQAAPPPTLPAPKGRGGKFSRLMALLLDDVIRIPGTKIRIGLDPILGLFPGGGDALAAFLGSSIPLEAARQGVPTPVLMKMLFNAIVNTLVGAIPGIGDVFSVWFRSNSRNYALLSEHAGTVAPRPILRWIAASGVLCIILIVASLTLWWWLCMRWLSQSYPFFEHITRFGPK